MTELEVIKNRICKRENIKAQAEIWRFKENKLVFTNGCFDILHPGHIEYLSKAADMGDKLIVGVNTNASVKSIKGEKKPIISEDYRAMQVAALAFVDAVVLFSEDTPENIIKEICPDVLVKGADYQEKEVVGADFVKENGGKVELIELTEGFSSSSLIQKIRN